MNSKTARVDGQMGFTFLEPLQRLLDCLLYILYIHIAPEDKAFGIAVTAKATAWKTLTEQVDSGMFNSMVLAGLANEFG